jgi:hypothetical protein
MMRCLLLWLEAALVVGTERGVMSSAEPVVVLAPRSNLRTSTGRTTMGDRGASVGIQGFLLSI